MSFNGRQISAGRRRGVFLYSVTLLFLFSFPVHRCSINTTAQLAHAIKPVFEYDERRLPGNAHETVFEARCFVWSKVDELKGLIASKEAKGTSIKSSREAAAQKMIQYLLQKDEHVKAESLPPSSNVSATPS